MLSSEMVEAKHDLEYYALYPRTRLGRIPSFLMDSRSSHSIGSFVIRLSSIVGWCLSSASPPHNPAQNLHHNIPVVGGKQNLAGFLPVPFTVFDTVPRRAQVD